MKQQNARPSPVLLILILLPLLYNCDRSGRLVEEAQGQIQQGHYNIALDRLLMARERDPHDLQAKLWLGRLLSTRRASVYSALELMTDALKQTRDLGVRREVIYLYLDLGQKEEARRILAPDRLEIEEFFSEPIVLLRTGVGCIVSPGERNLDALKDINEGEDRNYLIGRCLVSRYRNLTADQGTQAEFERLPASVQETVELIREHLELLDRRDMCRISVIAPRPLRRYVDLPAGSRCRKDFPASFEMARQRNESGLIVGAASSRKTLLFEEDFSIPPYPGDRIYRRFVPRGPDIPEESYEIEKKITIDDE